MDLVAFKPRTRPPSQPRTRSSIALEQADNSQAPEPARPNRMLRSSHALHRFEFYARRTFSHSGVTSPQSLALEDGLPYRSRTPNLSHRPGVVGSSSSTRAWLTSAASTSKSTVEQFFCSLHLRWKQVKMQKWWYCQSLDWLLWDATGALLYSYHTTFRSPTTSPGTLPSYRPRRSVTD
jgi:hypothetical protein